MTKENILQEVKKAMDATNNHVSNYYILSALSAALIEDIRHETNKAAGAGKVEKILKNLLDASKKDAAYQTRAHYAHIENGALYATDTHRLLKLYTPINAPLWEEKEPGVEWFKFYDMIDKKPELIPVTMPDINALKTFIKCTKKENPVIILEAENGEKITLNARFLENAITNFTDVKIYGSAENTRRGGVYVSGKEGEIYILPINNALVDTMQPGFYTQLYRSGSTSFKKFSFDFENVA